jgi:hypothetical protein
MVIGYTGDVRRFHNRDHYAAYTGTSPIEMSSGGRVVHRLSRRGNRQLNHAIHIAAITQIRHRHSPGREYYDRKLAEGKTAKNAIRASHTYWAVVNNPPSPGNATLARASDAGISVAEGGGAVNVIFPANISGCANVSSRNNAGTTVPGAGTAQTNTSPANPNAVEVHTRDEKGANADADFHLIVVCP